MDPVLDEFGVLGYLFRKVSLIVAPLEVQGSLFIEATLPLSLVLPLFGPWFVSGVVTNSHFSSQCHVIVSLENAN